MPEPTTIALVCARGLYCLYVDPPANPPVEGAERFGLFCTTAGTHTFVGKAQGSVGPATLGSFVIWNGTPGSEQVSDPTVTIQAANRGTTAIKADAWALLIQQGLNVYAMPWPKDNEPGTGNIWWGNAQENIPHGQSGGVFKSDGSVVIADNISESVDIFLGGSVLIFEDGHDNSINVIESGSQVEPCTFDQNILPGEMGQITMSDGNPRQAMNAEGVLPILGGSSEIDRFGFAFNNSGEWFTLPQGTMIFQTSNWEGGDWPSGDSRLVTIAGVGIQMLIKNDTSNTIPNGEEILVGHDRNQHRWVMWPLSGNPHTGNIYQAVLKTRLKATQTTATIVQDDLFKYHGPPSGDYTVSNPLEFRADINSKVLIEEMPEPGWSGGTNATAFCRIIAIETQVPRVRFYTASTMGPMTSTTPTVNCNSLTALDGYNGTGSVPAQVVARNQQKYSCQSGSSITIAEMWASETDDPEYLIIGVEHKTVTVLTYLGISGQKLQYKTTKINAMWEEDEGNIQEITLPTGESEGVLTEVIGIVDYVGDEFVVYRQQVRVLEAQQVTGPHPFLQTKQTEVVDHAVYSEGSIITYNKQVQVIDTGNTSPDTILTFDNASYMTWLTINGAEISFERATAKVINPTPISGGNGTITISGVPVTVVGNVSEDADSLNQAFTTFTALSGGGIGQPQVIAAIESCPAAMASTEATELRAEIDDLRALVQSLVAKLGEK